MLVFVSSACNVLPKFRGEGHLCHYFSLATEMTQLDTFRADSLPMPDFRWPKGKRFSRCLVEAEQIPAELATLCAADAEVHIWGTLPPGPRVGIVGTRKPSRGGALSAFHLARRLARAGVTVVSGGAIGIDTAAHLGALAGGGRSLVVAPVWLDRAYPKENRALFTAILRRGGGYLSISDEAAPLLPFVFFRRNEALVSLCDVLVLGECPMKSGAKNAMLHARKLNRERYILAYPYGEKRAAGSHQELMRGGAVLLHQPEPLLERLLAFDASQNQLFWQWACSASAAALEANHEKLTRRKVRRSGSHSGSIPLEPSPPPQDELLAQKDPLQRAVLEAITSGAGTIDEICHQSGLSPSQVQHQVLLFTLEGLIIEDDAGLLRYQGARHGRS